MDVFLEIYTMYILGNYSTYFLKKILTRSRLSRGACIGGEATGEIAKDSTVKNKANYI